MEKHKHKYGFETINEVCEMGGKFKVYRPNKHLITDVDFYTYKDLERANPNTMIIFTKNNTSHVFNGMRDALAACGENVVEWSREQKPTFDMIYESKPKLIFLTQECINQENIEAISAYQIPTVIEGAWSTEALQNQIINVVPETMPDQLLQGRRHLKAKTMANLVRYRNGISSAKDDTDVLYITHKDVFYEMNLKSSEWLVSLLPRVLHRIKICGNSTVASPYYVGPLKTISEEMGLKKSCKVCIDFGGDTIYDNAANKVFTLSNVDSHLFDNFKTPEEFVEKIDLYVTQDKLRRSKVRKAYKYTISERTYFHTIDELQGVVGMEWKQKPLDVLKRVIE